MKSEFKGQDISQTIRDINIKAFLDWCHKNNLDDLAYQKDFHGRTIAETPEELQSRMRCEWEIKGLVVAYLYDVRPEFIKRVESLGAPDIFHVGYYYLNPLGEYYTLFLNKEFAMELMNSREKSATSWRSDVGLKTGSKAWKQMRARLSRAYLLSE